MLTGLVTDARAIFLDEPTTGLDSDSAEQLISLLSHLATHKFRTVRMPAAPCLLCLIKPCHRKPRCALPETHMRQQLPAKFVAYIETWSACGRLDGFASETCMAKAAGCKGQPDTDMRAWLPQIVCTIHQPSSDICERFDDLILLSCGRMLYCGRWAAADAYFAAAGFECGPLHLA